MTNPVWNALIALPLAHAAASAYGAVRVMRGVSRIPALRRDDEKGAVARLPRLSIIVPACNEASTIELALRSKLASKYPDLELIVVEDRSSDDTGAIVDRIALEDPRLRVVHVTELPEGWLGKLHALDRGAAVATGELLLFSDADVLFSEDVLVRAATAMEKGGLDFVTLIPDMTPVSPVLDAVITTFLRMLLTSGRIWRMRDPNSRVAIGAGVFNLVRRTIYQSTPGFAHIKMEVVDDVAFGQMMKRAGARCDVFQARGDVMLPYYGSLGEMIRGLEKNGYAVASGFRPLVAVVSLSAVALLEFLPIVAMVTWEGWPRTLAVAAVVLLAGAQLALARWLGRPLATALFPWFGALVLFVALARSMIIVHARGGIGWRGTFYPLAALRSGIRLERP